MANPEARLGELELLGGEERHQLLVEWNATAAQLPVGRSITELFEEQVARSPEATAVVFGERSLSYAELEERANRLGHHLRELGVGPEVLVGLCLERERGAGGGDAGHPQGGGCVRAAGPGVPGGAAGVHARGQRRARWW